MQNQLQGKVYKFGDNINSDIIIAGRYLIYIEPDKLAEHAFEMLGEGFPARLREFDILVAGRNFGCGSAREQAVTAIIGLGFKAVVACSFARTFYRNAINSGRVRPYVTSGVGGAYVSADLDNINDKEPHNRFMWNAGGGVKLIAGELVLDFRFTNHRLLGSGAENTTNLRSVSVGVGYRFGK